MALNRIWTPSGNYSSGGTKRLIVIHTMEGFTGPNGAYDCAIYFKGNVGASSQVCIDNNRGTIWECVSRNNGAWTQCNFNSVSVSVEQCGYASWSSDYWLANREPQLRNIAEWIAEESKKLGIPIVKLTSSQAQSNGKGICYHSDLGSAGCGHSDPGSGWPLNQVIEWAKGGSIPPAVEEVVSGMTSSSTFDNSGRLHLAAIDQHSHVCYKGPNGNWYPVNPIQDAKSGVTINVGPPTTTYEFGEIVITYTSKPDDKVCTWRKGVDNPEQWRHTGHGGSYQ